MRNRVFYRSFGRKGATNRSDNSLISPPRGKRGRDRERWGEEREKEKDKESTSLCSVLDLEFQAHRTYTEEVLSLVHVTDSWSPSNPHMWIHERREKDFHRHTSELQRDLFMWYQSIIRVTCSKSSFYPHHEIFRVRNSVSRSFLASPYIARIFTLFLCSLIILQIN